MIQTRQIRRIQKLRAELKLTQDDINVILEKRYGVSSMLWLRKHLADDLISYLERFRESRFTRILKGFNRLLLGA